MTNSLEKILYVEDDTDISEVVLLALEDLGNFNVKHCASGAEALETLAEFTPQLILMDVMMPAMDGPETLRRIRGNLAWMDIPVIFMTARAQTHEQDSYVAMGAIGVIVKPFDPMQLCSQIGDMWRRASCVQESGSR